VVIALAVLWLVDGGGVEAHVGGTTGFAAVTVDRQTVRYTLSLGVEVIEAATPDPRRTGDRRVSDDEALANIVTRHVTVTADDNACAPLPGIVQPAPPGRSTITIVVQYACAAPVKTLVVRDELFRALGRDHHTIARVEWPGGHQQVMFDPDQREARVIIGLSGAPADYAAPRGAASFFWVGLEHILAGFDHVLFLLALILGGGSIKSLLGIVTAFTVAHSTTLGLAALNVVRPPEWLVEPLIAISIAYVAVENIVARRRTVRRWLASFLFGLVHGFGFAGALLELGLPTDALVSSLLFFNLGVEAGQAMIVALLFPAIVWLSRWPWRRLAVSCISAAVLTAAMALLVARL
jgi:hypothetical protein